MADKKITEAKIIAPKRKINFRRIIFVASLGLNLLFVGMFVGVALRVGSWAHYGHGGGEKIAGSAYIRALDHDSRHALADIMRSTRRSDGDDTATRNSALYTEAITLLRAESVDEDALRAVMERHVEISFVRLGRATEAMAVHLAGLDVARRRAYADRLEEAIKRKRHHGRR